MYQGKGQMIRKFGENLIEKVKLYISPELVSMFPNQKRNSPKGFEQNHQTQIVQKNSGGRKSLMINLHIQRTSSDYSSICM